MFESRSSNQLTSGAKDNSSDILLLADTQSKSSSGTDSNSGTDAGTESNSQLNSNGQTNSDSQPKCASYPKCSYKQPEVLPDLKLVEKRNAYGKSGELPQKDGRVADITGPGISDQWGMRSTDLGMTILMPNGKLISMFGDTFSGAIGQGDWRSPVALIGTGDASHLIRYDSAAGADPNYAKQLIDYVHDDPSSGWSKGGISTVIPDDVLKIGDKMYFHGIENQGFGNVVSTGIWESNDNGVSWDRIAKFPGNMDRGYAQCWTWDYNPDDGFVYIASTGFQRDKGIILHRARPEDLGDHNKYSSWGFSNGKWSWDNAPTAITPEGENWGELTLRRLGKDQWVLGGFLSSQYALGYRTIASPTSDMYNTPIQKPVVGVGWSEDDPEHNKVAQLYGGFILPGSQLDKPGGVGLIVSQWNTGTGYPYKSMQFTATLKNTIPKSSEVSGLSKQFQFDPASASLPGKDAFRGTATSDQQASCEKELALS